MEIKLKVAWKVITKERTSSILSYVSYNREYITQYPKHSFVIPRKKHTLGLMVFETRAQARHFKRIEKEIDRKHREKLSVIRVLVPIEYISEIKKIPYLEDIKDFYEPYTKNPFFPVKMMPAPNNTLVTPWLFTID